MYPNAITGSKRELPSKLLSKEKEIEGEQRWMELLLAAFFFIFSSFLSEVIASLYKSSDPRLH